MSSIRILAPTLAALLLAACVAPAPTKPATSAATTAAPPLSPAIDFTEPFSDATVDAVKEKFRSNAPNLLCDQPLYASCYNLSHAQCMAEVAELTPDCLSRADVSYPSIRMKADLQKYSQTVGTCLALGHLNRHSDRMQVLSQCIQGISFDAERGQQSLFK
jgi:hypothetical protein